MEIKFTCFDGLTRIKFELHKFIETSLYFYDIDDFQSWLKSEHIHPITEKLWGCGFVEATSFPIVVQSLEMIYECIHHYNLDTRKIILPDDIILISIDRKRVVNYLHVPEQDEFSDLTFRRAILEFWVKKMIWRKEIMRNWL